MTTQGNELRDLSAETVARVVKMLAEMGNVAQAALQEPAERAPHDAFDQGTAVATVHVTCTGVYFPKLQPAPGPQRIEVRFAQLGGQFGEFALFLPAPDPGQALPYAPGQHYRLPVMPL